MMNFSSVKEYFYKMYNVCYAITLIPLAVFIYIYMELRAGGILPLVKDEEWVLGGMVCLIILGITTLTIVHLLTRKASRILAKEAGLGIKLDGYYSIAIRRIVTGTAVSVAMGAGLYATGNEIFSLVFLLILSWMAFQWPTSARLCKDLSLKGDEREMILYKKESL
jgi:hypothetical protein